MMKRSAALRWRCAHRLSPGLRGRVAQPHQVRTRCLRFGPNREPEECDRCEGRHSSQRHGISCRRWCHELRDSTLEYWLIKYGLYATAPFGLPANAREHDPEKPGPDLIRAGYRFSERIMLQA